MSLRLKITLGIFIGVAAFVAIEVTAWIENFRREGAYRDAYFAMHVMTPDLAIQRCGKPDKDVFLDAHSEMRQIYFKQRGSTGHPMGAVLDFLKNDNGKWSLQYMADLAGGSDIREGKKIRSDEGHYNEAWKQLLALPCLEGKQH